MKLAQADIANGVASLHQAGWLSGTTSDFRDAVLARCQWLSITVGQTISHGGDASGGMFGIARGGFSLTPAVGAADAPIIHIGSAPFWYGTNPLIALTRSVSVIARSPCLIALLPQHALKSLLAENPLYWRFIAESVSEMLALVSQIATDLLLRDSTRRCIAVILRVAGCRNGGTSPGLADMTQDELSGMANMSRQTTGPILRDLAHAGLLTVGYRNIVLHDPAALRAMLEV